MCNWVIKLSILYIVYRYILFQTIFTCLKSQLRVLCSERKCEDEFLFTMNKYTVCLCMSCDTSG